MQFRLSPAARANGYRLHVHDVLGSTNAQALALARSGENGPLWIAAHRQNAGRGRRGNAWISPEGNLAASLLLPVTGVASGHVATLGFVAGLALTDALDDAFSCNPHPECLADKSWPTHRPHPEVLRSSLEGGLQAARRPLEPSFEARLRRASQDEGVGEKSTFRPDTRDEGGDGKTDVFRLKWPNDVLAEGRKIAGILLEAEGRRAVAIGIGVNVAAAPDGLPYPATALATLGCTADAADLFECLTGRFVETLRIWNKGRGFSDVRRRWLERAAGVGSPVTVRLPGGTLSGHHNGIDEEGRLVILAPDGQSHTVTAGEVHFGEAATAA